MKFETSIGLDRPEAPPDRLAILQVKMRRAKWFEYTQRRFDLVSLDQLADWCSRESGGFERSESRRAAAFLDLFNAIQNGEFGSGSWPALAHLPAVVPTYDKFPLRLSLGQISILHAQGHNPVADLWAPRSLCVTWIKARKLDLPPWLGIPDQSQTPYVQPTTTANAPPVFDFTKTYAHVLHLKHSKQKRPSREALAADLNITRTMAEKALKKADWPGERGRKSS
jgi:hypothetical protein